MNAHNAIMFSSVPVSDVFAGNVELSDEEMRPRLAGWTQPEPRYTSGVLAKYAALVSQADQGAVTRPLV